MTRQATITVAAIVMLAGSAAWSYARLTRTRASAATAAGELAECRRHAAIIHSLADRPALADDAERQSAQTSRLIEQAASAAGIDARQLIRISPGQARRVGDSPYTDKPTAVTLRAVRTDQLVKFIHAVQAAPQGLTCSAIRLDAAGDGSKPLWSAEVELTYLIYEPPGAKE